MTHTHTQTNTTLHTHKHWLSLCVCVSDVSMSCRNRCDEPFEENSADCRCDVQCVTSDNCCHDYEDTCLQPSKWGVQRWMLFSSELLCDWTMCVLAQSWECSAGRCGETRLSDRKCYCSHDCVSAGDCCSNYHIICRGDNINTHAFRVVYVWLYVMIMMIPAGDTQWVQDECVNMSSPQCPAR